MQGVEGEVEDKRLRLKRQGSMLKTMFCATVRASRLVSAVRYVTDLARFGMHLRDHPGSRKASL